LRLPVQDSPAGAFVDRLLAITLAGLAAFFVVVLGRVAPDGRGHGTHEQLGMAPCSWPILYDAPCPTCGVTTAATHLVHLDPIRAVATQPFGAFLAGLGLYAAWLAARSLVCRTSLVGELATKPYGRLIRLALLLGFGSWAYVWLTWPTPA
jgi:hypothetical protein